MATAPPPPPPDEPVRLVESGPPGDPSNRWPWVALGLGLLIVGVAIVFFLLNRPRTVNVALEGPSPAALAVSPGPPATLVPPTLPASATLAPTATPVPTATRQPASPTPVPAPTPPPVVATAPAPPPPTPLPVQPAPPTQAAAATPATTLAATQPAVAAPVTTLAPAQPAAAAPAATARPAATAPAGPTPPAAQASAGGGVGNPRADLDAAYGPPPGETPEHLVVYRKGTLEYHVRFVPDANGRAALLVVTTPPQVFTLEQAMIEAHKLLPRDAQPPNPPQEAGPQYVVERYTSQTLAQALPADAFAANKGQPGQFLVVYVRDPAQAVRITRFIIGPGTDPNALVTQGN